jgi:hypothetical protein
LAGYQLKQAANQPNEQNISQNRQQISQTSKISAKAHNKSAKPKSMSKHTFFYKTAKDKKTFGKKFPFINYVII